MKPLMKLIVSNGELALLLVREKLVDPWTVTSPFHPGVVTESHTVEGAFGYFEEALARWRESNDRQSPYCAV